MRPRKVVLCCCDDSEQLSRRAFVLDTWGYHALRASSVADAMGLLEGERMIGGVVDLLLLDLPVKGFDASASARTRELQPEIRVLAVGQEPGHDLEFCANVYLARGGNSAAYVREQARILVQRKRGPKPVATGAMARVA